MIFLTVGSEMPFPRLIRAFDEWCGARHRTDCFIQTAEPAGQGYEPQHAEWKAFLSPEEFEQKFNAADLIVAHAGMGTIITALTKSKPIVVMPRVAALNETRNDHQGATADRFGTREGVFVSSDEHGLANILDEVVASNLSGLAMGRASPYADQTLLDTLHDFIWKSSSSPHGRT